MTSLINLLRRILSFHDCFSSYRPLPKKDDDSGIQRAEAWMKANPIEESTLNRYNMTCQQVNAYGKRVIQGLKLSHVDSSNEELIKSHLVEICKKNYEVRKYLFDHLTEIKADDSVIKALRETVCFTYPPN